MIELEELRKNKNVIVKDFDKLPSDMKEYYEKIVDSGEYKGISIYGAEYEANKYEYFGNSVYYLPNNVILDGRYSSGYDFVKFDSKRYIVLDYFVLDLVDKKIAVYEQWVDGFTDSLGEIKNIKIEEDKESKGRKIIINDKIIITIDKDNRIIKYDNELVKDITSDFMHRSKNIKSINIPNVETISDYFMESDGNIQELNLPNVKKIGSDFMPCNQALKKANFHNLQQIDYAFMEGNNSLEEIDLSSLNEECYDRLPEYIWNLVQNKKVIK